MNGQKVFSRDGFEVRPRYTCCHSNMEGTGTCVRFELHPAHECEEGSVFATFAAQKTLGSYGDGEIVPPTFDWENKITVRLTINEVAELLEVFRGYRECLADGKGFFHRSQNANTVINLEHRLEPGPGYLFSVSKKGNDGVLNRASILLTMKETIVLSEALASAMLYMAFGIPKVIRRKEKHSSKVATTGNAAKDVA